MSPARSRFVGVDQHRASSNSTTSRLPPTNAPEARLIGGAVQENKEKAAKANPITYVTKDSAPFLIMHGEEDRVVPIGQSELLDEALRKAGVESTFVRVPGNGHGGPGFASPENRKRIDEFFQKHLK